MNTTTSIHENQEITIVTLDMIERMEAEVSQQKEFRAMMKRESELLQDILPEPSVV